MLDDDQDAVKQDPRNGVQVDFHSSRLMNLPEHVRRLILRHLLHDPKPLYFAGPLPTPDEDAFNLFDEQFRSHRLYPVILSTCKKLQEEGENILYGNTIKCVIAMSTAHFGEHANRPTTVTFLSQKYGRMLEASSAQLPFGLQHKARKLELDVLLTVSAPCPMSYNTHISTLKAIYDVIDFVRSSKSYREINVNLQISLQEIGGQLLLPTKHNHEAFTAQFERYRDKVAYQAFYPLTLLRNMQHVTAPDAHPNLRDRLQRVSPNEPFLDIRAMYKVLAAQYASVGHASSRWNDKLAAEWVDFYVEDTPGLSWERHITPATTAMKRLFFVPVIVFSACIT
jgi:hypothetical protein